MVISMDRWSGKVAVVTGASSGIGAAIAERLVSKGVKVVGLARRKEHVEELAKKLEGKPGKLYALKTDMTVEDDIVNAFKWVNENIGPISILINNAGIVHRTDLGNLNTEVIRALFDTNVIGLSIATSEAISSMEENKIDGHIIHVSSVAAHMIPIRAGGIYCATKWSVNILAEALRKELVEKKSKTKISIISPGLVDTELLDGALVDKAVTPMLRSEDIADAAEYILSTPPTVQIHEMIVKPVGELF